MKNYLLSFLFLFALLSSAVGQTTLVDFETVQDPFVEPFDLTSYENGVENPDGSGYVGKAVKTGDKFWGGINIYFGGDVQFTGTNDKFKIDFYTTDPGINDTIQFKFQLFNRTGGVETIEVDAYYTDTDDTEVGVWKTLEFPIPDGTTGSYNQMVIFFGWEYSNDGDEYYFDNVVAPGFSPYGNTDVTFNITDKFNNAEDIKLFIDGTESTLDKNNNVYSTTSSLASYNVTAGQSQGVYEIVYSHVANDEEVRDTTTVLVGNASGTQTVAYLIIVEDEEDGTADAISVGETPPAIDGTIDEVWSNAKTHTMQKRSWWGAPTGLYSTWKVMWDIDNVYLLYTIEDETPHGGNTTDLWKNDNVETFFDMNQSASTPYDNDDWQIRTIRGSEIWSGSEDVTDTWAEDLERAQVEMENNAGYIIELAIPWGSLSGSFVPIAGSDFNYDCVASDVTAEGGPRTYRESWTTDQDIAYYDTQYFGTITLSDKTNEFEDTSTAIVQIPENLMQVKMYPNPVQETLFLGNMKDVKSVVVRNILGATVREIKVTRQNMYVDLSELNTGFYTVTFLDGKGNSNSLKLLKQ
jgi:hypothetical protein